MEELKCEWTDLSITPTNLVWELDADSVFTPPFQQLRIKSVGVGTLSSRWSIHSDASWLTVSPDNGEGGGWVVVHVKITGLVAGIYVALLTFSSDVNIEITPSIIPVKLVLKGKSITKVDNESIEIEDSFLTKKYTPPQPTPTKKNTWVCKVVKRIKKSFSL